MDYGNTQITRPACTIRCPMFQNYEPGQYNYVRNVKGSTVVWILGIKHLGFLMWITWWRSLFLQTHVMLPDTFLRQISAVQANPNALQCSLSWQINSALLIKSHTQQRFSYWQINSAILIKSHTRKEHNNIHLYRFSQYLTWHASKNWVNTTRQHPQKRLFLSST